LLVDGLLVFIIVWLYARAPRPRLAVGALFTTMYGCARFFTEFYRVPDWERTYAGITITSGQALSLPMIIGGLLMLAWAYRHPHFAGAAKAQAR
jgi:phosphatidylglycerol:prolipoprotein diacylglycerol transferase